MRVVIGVRRRSEQRTDVINDQNLRLSPWPVANVHWSPLITKERWRRIQLRGHREFD